VPIPLSFSTAWTGPWVLSALLVILPTSIFAEEKDRVPDLNGPLPELQKAVGKDWSVTTLLDGYLITYVPQVSFYPAVSDSTKLDEHQRALHGRTDHLHIRITFLFPPAMENADQFNAFWRGVHPAAGYFECGAEDWLMGGYYLHEKPPANALFNSNVLFTSNFAPDQLVFPRETVDVYEQALDALAPLFCCARHSNWD